jgi:hypothetical protein
MARSCIRASLRCRRSKGVITRRFRVGIQLVPHEAHRLHVGRMLIHQFVENVRPISVGALRSDVGLPCTREWFKRDQTICCAMPLVLCVIPSWLPRRSG